MKQANKRKCLVNFLLMPSLYFRIDKGLLQQCDFVDGVLEGWSDFWHYWSAELKPPLFPLNCLKAVSSMADMKAHRGVIYDTCHHGLLSRPGTSPTPLERGNSVPQWG